jgi:secreted protein with Ig-like and vWFA domain
MTRDHDPHDAAPGGTHDGAKAPEGTQTPDERLRALLGDGLDGMEVTPEEQAAVKLTAHALGELSGETAAEIERRLEAPEAKTQRAKVAEVRAIGAALRQSAPAAHAPREPVGSPSIRTAVTAALATRDAKAKAPRGGGTVPVGSGSPAGRGLFVQLSSGPLSAVPMLVAAGTTAAAVLALIVTLDPPSRPVRDPRPAIEQTDVMVRELAAAARPTEEMLREAIPLGDSPVAKAESLAQADGLAALAEASADKSGAAVGPAERFSELAAQESAPALPTAAALPAPAGPAPAVVASKRMDESKQLQDFEEHVVDPSLLAAGPGSGAGGISLGRNGQAPPRGGGPGLERGMMPDRLADGEAGPPGQPSRAAGSMGLSPPPVALGLQYESQEARSDWFKQRDVDRLTLSKAAPGTERYGKFVENAFRNPADKEQALSTFSIDVDTASYALVRRFLHDRQIPPADAVRLEEMLNYFRYDDTPPVGDDPFSVSLETAACPWRAGHRLVRVGLKGREIAAAARPGTSLVFLVDVSGSMNEPNKLPLVKQSLSMLVDQLTENDKVAIVTYAGDAGLKLAPTSGDQKGRIRGAIEALSAGGSTNGSAGIELAYAQAAEAFVKGGSNRVVLATDGDLNVGVTSDAALVELIKQKALGGVFLTVLGYGQGNLQDEKMEKLADNGNGIYAYIDGAREARKVLVEQLTGSTVTIAKDVKIQVEFNPAQVAAYRLLGYENRIMAAKDFKDDTKDAGEIGAGHGVTALYEIVPTAAADKSPVVDEPLKYQPKETVAAKPAVAADVGPASSELLTLKLRYKEPTGDTSQERVFPLEDTGTTFENASTNLRFAAAVAEFGMLLRGSAHRGEATLAHVTATAAGALGTDPGGLRAEFLDLVREAGALLPHRGGPIPN